MRVLSLGRTGTMAQASAPSPRCLVVEDEVLIGMDLEDNLCGAGFDVQWAASARTASELLACAPFDVAVLDVALRSESCVPLACELKRRRVPFLVYSGLPRDGSLAELRDAPWLEKPSETTTLIAALAEVMDLPPAPGLEGARGTLRMPQTGSR